MKKEVIFSLSGLYRDDFRVTGYRFGSGEPSCCIIGAIRGDEVQQLYICGQLVKALRELEKSGRIAEGKEILVIPSMNNYSMNISRRFWCLDNTDINRQFPGDGGGETTERVAAAVFGEIRKYPYCVQFPSFYIPGIFAPHVRMMKTEAHNESAAELFGLPFVVLREPTALDKSTLNFSLQSSGTAAFSVYTETRETIDEISAEIGVEAVLRFLSKTGVITSEVREGVAAKVVDESELVNVKSEDAGIYREIVKVGSAVKEGDVLARILHPYEGEVIREVKAPVDGTVFFARHKSIICQHSLVFKIVKK